MKCRRKIFAYVRKGGREGFFKNVNALLSKRVRDVLLNR